MTIDRTSLVVDNEKKTEVIKIRCTKTTKQLWEEFLQVNNLKTSEDGLLKVFTKKMDLDIAMKI